MKKTLTLLSTVLLLGLFLNACDSDDDTDQEPKSDKDGSVTLKFSAKVAQSALDYDQMYDLEDGKKWEISTAQFFLSDVYAVRENGERELISEIELINFDETSSFYNVEITGELPVAGYEYIEFSSGVKQELNEADPADYDPGHPLNSTTGMYWTWNTNYIFQKLEGSVEDPEQDSTLSWFFHTGLNELYRPDIRLERTFSVQENTSTNVGIIVDLRKVIYGEHELDLWENGQTHTSDNKELAEKVVDNFKNAFE